MSHKNNHADQGNPHDDRDHCQPAVDREVAAIAALQGILSGSSRMALNPSLAARLAIECADELVKQLSK